MALKSKTKIQKQSLSKLQILENFKFQNDLSKNDIFFKIGEIQNSNEASESKLRACSSKNVEITLGPSGGPKNFIWSSFEYNLEKVFVIKNDDFNECNLWFVMFWGN